MTFTSRIADTLPLEITGLLPSWTAGKSLAEIERFEVLHGNRRLPLAEFFAASGSAEDGVLRFTGNTVSVHRLGVGMDSGKIVVEGSIGHHCGAQMTGGEISVGGDTSDFLGCEMRGGTIRVAGNAGRATGSAYAGSTRGMCAGTILVRGNVGDESANCMRRGLVAVGGAAGAYLGVDMLAGSILVFGSCGQRVGANMRRGTIALLGAVPPLLSTFRRGPRGHSLILRMLVVHLSRGGFPIPDGALDAAYEQFHGDSLSLGRGEIFIRCDN